MIRKSHSGVDAKEPHEWYDRLLYLDTDEIERDILDEIEFPDLSTVTIRTGDRTPRISIYRINFGSDSSIYEWAEESGAEMSDRTREDTGKLSDEEFAEYALEPSFKFFKGAADAYYGVIGDIEDKLSVVETPRDHLEYVSGVDSFLNNIHRNSMTNMPDYSKFMDHGRAIVNEGYRRNHPESTILG